MKRNSSDVPFAPVGSDSVSLIISVEDTGVGIPFEAQSRVFTPFMQAGPSIARINGGTGIGLSINRCLIGLMKGEIKFASKPEVGSTFTFTAVLTRACSRGNENKSSEFKEINALVFDHRLVRAEVTKYHLQRLGVQTELTTDLDRYISKVNCGLQIAKVVFIDIETWLKESHSMPHLLSKLRSKAQTYPPKLFLLENPTSSVKGSSHVSREYNLNVIMKPLRASLLQISLRRALGWDADEGHFRNGGVGNSTVDCLLFRNIVDCLLHKKQIIVVDDDIVSLKLAAAALKKYGAEVTCVDSGKKAVTLLQPPHSFDACFMDIHMPEMDGFEATSRIRAMERDLNERIGRGELPPECASVGQWRTPILAMTADVSPLIHEACLKSEMDGYVSKPFEGGKLYSEYARFLQTNKNPSSLELSNIVNHQILEKLEQDEFVSQERLLNLHLEVQEKLEEAERKLEELRMRSKFITMVIKKLTSVIYLQKKVVLSVILLGLMLYSLLVITGAFDFPFHQSLRITRAGQNMMVNDFGWSHGRLLYATTLSGTWANETVSVDLNTTAGNNDSSGQQQHWYSHYSIKYQEETGEMQKQNRTVKPHLPAHMSHKTTVGPWIWIALVSLTMLVLGIAIAVWLLLWCIRRKRAQQNELELFGGLGHRRFQLYELAAATSNFRDDNKIGQGGFGPVYKGYLRNQDCLVAIKVLTKTQFEQGLKEFKAEVKVMTQLRHRNIVKLFGWCNSKKRLLLVYELMAQGSLDKHLYDPEKILTWQQRYRNWLANLLFISHSQLIEHYKHDLFKLTVNLLLMTKLAPARYKIVLDLGAGLLYLHQDCEKCVVHGDIKPANVMLDVSYNAKLGDFGLARLIEHSDQPQTTQNIAGTPGYIDPEFLNNRWPRTELDVYSFGVVLLEIACGKRPASSLLAWVRDLYDRGLILDAADQRLNGEFDQQQMERVLVTGLWCALQDPMPRPSILQAMDVLRCARAELPVLPAAHDARRIRSMEEQAYGDLLPVEDRSVHALAPSRYFTSKDSVYLLAEE
jgi:serine/threonine protein kinase/DNA-binding response OmpR family regulator